MLTPLTAVLLALTVVPFAYNLVVSFTNKSSISSHTSFIGLQNYWDLLTSGPFWATIRTSAILLVITVGIEFVLALAVAVAMTKITRGASLLRALFLLPMAAAPVATLYNWRIMLNVSFGVVNYVLGSIGLPQPNWTGEANTALATIAMVDIWMWTPFIMMILVGGMASIPDDLYEASAVDGAGQWSSFLHITLPLLRPYILVAVLFRSIDALKTFDSVQILTSGGPGSSTTTLNYFIFQQGIDFLDFGRAAAAATILLIIATILSRALLSGLRAKEVR